MRFSDWNLVCLPGIAFPSAIVPSNNHAGAGIPFRYKLNIISCSRPPLKFYSGYRRGHHERAIQIWEAGLTSAALAHRSASRLPHPFSADRGGRNRDIETCAVPCRPKAALASRPPRSGGKSIFQPRPWNNSAPPMEQFCRRFGNFVNSKKWATPKEARALRRRRLNLLRQEN